MALHEVSTSRTLNHLKKHRPSSQRFREGKAVVMQVSIVTSFQRTFSQDQIEALLVQLLVKQDELLLMLSKGFIEMILALNRLAQLFNAVTLRQK